MAARALVAAILAACSAQIFAVTDGSQVSLVQSAVQVHSTPDTKIVKGRFLVDNSKLKHSGPGVLLRRSKQMDDVVGFDQFLSWGTVFDGQVDGEGWVKYDKYFLPTSVKGAQILTLQSIVLDKNTPAIQHQARVYRFHYAPTNVKLGGTSAPCRIVRAGHKPETYTVEVFPPHFASYVTDVPAASLEKVRRIRDFDPVVKEEKVEEPEPAIHFFVKDTTQEEAMALKMFTKSPMRAIMKMACDRSGIPWFKCQKKVKFLWKDGELSPDAHVDELKMADGETITMVRP